MQAHSKFFTDLHKRIVKKFLPGQYPDNLCTQVFEVTCCKYAVFAVGITGFLVLTDAMHGLFLRARLPAMKEWMRWMAGLAVRFAFIFIAGFATMFMEWIPEAERKPVLFSALLGVSLSIAIEAAFAFRRLNKI